MERLPLDKRVVGEWAEQPGRGRQCLDPADALHVHEPHALDPEDPEQERDGADGNAGAGAYRGGARGCKG